MKTSLSAHVYIRLDALEQFDWPTPTGMIRADQLIFHMAQSESQEGLFALPPEVAVSGRAIKADGKMGQIRRQGVIKTRSLPPEIMAQLPRRAQFHGGVG